MTLPPSVTFPKPLCKQHNLGFLFRCTMKIIMMGKLAKLRIRSANRPSVAAAWNCIPKITNQSRSDQIIRGRRIQRTMSAPKLTAHPPASISAWIVVGGAGSRLHSHRHGWRRSHRGRRRWLWSGARCYWWWERWCVYLRFVWGLHKRWRQKVCWHNCTKLTSWLRWEFRQDSRLRTQCLSRTYQYLIHQCM